MQNRALIVKMYGDPGIGNAIRTGMRLDKEQLALVKAECEAQRLSEARIGVMQARVANDWKEEIAKARAAYKPLSEPLTMCKRILIAWAMICYGVDQAFKRLAAMNRS